MGSRKQRRNEQEEGVARRNWLGFTTAMCNLHTRKRTRGGWARRKWLEKGLADRNDGRNFGEMMMRSAKTQRAMDGRWRRVETLTDITKRHTESRNTRTQGGGTLSIDGACTHSWHIQRLVSEYCICTIQSCPFPLAHVEQCMPHITRFHVLNVDTCSYY